MTAPKTNPIRVVVVDDSAVVRRMVSDALNAEPDIEVIGTAGDPYQARDRIKELKPDVITLDVEMPRMDGITFLGILMRERPMPVIVMSSISAAGSEVALEALRLGAIDVLAKPGGAYSFGDLGPRLVQAVRGAAIARVRPAPFTPPFNSGVRSATVSPALAPPPAPIRAALPPHHAPSDNRRLILLGASTGGTEALRDVLTKLPAGLPPIAIVQHIPAGFSKAFADRLNSLCAFTVREAVHDELCEPGLALVAPGDFHLVLRWTERGYRTVLSSGPQVWHQRPAVDVLFKSIPPPLCRHVIAGVLTGMGKDGAEGLHRLSAEGALTFAQDEASSVVYGMPRAAWELGGADDQVSLEHMPSHLLQLCTQRAKRKVHVGT